MSTPRKKTGDGERKMGLGRGLSSLLSAFPEPDAAQGTESVAVDSLSPGTHQPRRCFDEEALTELSASIKKQGVLQPLLVRPLPGLPLRYEIIAGERRWKAAQMAGLREIPVVIVHFSDQEAMAAALTENIQRENLNPWEEAEALKRLREEFGLSQEELAAQLGKSRSAVANALRLLQLPQEILEGLAKNFLSAGHARALLSLNGNPLQMDLYAIVRERSLSVRETEAAVEEIGRTGRLPERLRSEKTPPPVRTPKPDILKELQKNLRKNMKMRVVINGTEQKGKVQIPYSSPEDLERIMRLFGSEEKGNEAN